MNQLRHVVLPALVLLTACSTGPEPVKPQPQVISEGVAEVTVRVHGVTDTRGMIHCGMFSDPDDWLSAEVDYAKSMPVGEKGEVVELVIPNVASGGLRLQPLPGSRRQQHAQSKQLRYPDRSLGDVQ